MMTAISVFGRMVLAEVVIALSGSFRLNENFGWSWV